MGKGERKRRGEKDKKRRCGQEMAGHIGGRMSGTEKESQRVQDALRKHISRTITFQERIEKKEEKKKSVPHDCTQKKADGIVEQASKGGIANLISCLMNEGSIKNL